MPETDEITGPVLIAVTALPGAMFWRQNSGVFRTMDGLRIVKVSAVGIADIMGGYRGNAVAIETKVATGRFLLSQKRFREAWERAGNIYIVARGATAVQDAVEAVRALPHVR